jgi:hypothetical protein
MLVPTGLPEYVCRHISKILDVTPFKSANYHLLQLCITHIDKNQLEYWIRLIVVGIKGNSFRSLMYEIEQSTMSAFANNLLSTNHNNNPIYQ